MNVFFEVVTPLRCKIRTTKEYWHYLGEKKHPYMANRKDTAKSILKEPDEIRKSTLDPTVYLYYRKIDRLYCAVAKHQTDKEGFLITVYPVDKAKEGDVIWRR